MRTGTALPSVLENFRLAWVAGGIVFACVKVLAAKAREKASTLPKISLRERSRRLRRLTFVAPFLPTWHSQNDPTKNVARFCLNPAILFKNVPLTTPSMNTSAGLHLFARNQAYVRYIKILTSLRGFLVIFLYLVCFLCAQVSSGYYVTMDL